MGRALLLVVGFAALAFVACQAQHGGAPSDGQSHWLRPCQSSLQCGDDAQCWCGVCSRECGTAVECGGGQCAEPATLGDACAAEGVPARICLPAANATLEDASQANPTVDASAGPMPRAGANSVGVPDGGGAGTMAIDAGMSGGGGDAAMPFDAAVCNGYDSDATPSTITIRLVNATTDRLYLGPTQMGCSEAPRFTLETTEGDVVQGQGNPCAFSCTNIQLGACACPPVCPTTDVIALMPGDDFQTVWQGTLFASEVMPDACYPASCQAGFPCRVEHTAEQPLIVKALGYPEVTCGEGVTCMPCEQIGENCVLIGPNLVRGTPRMASAAWDPGQGVVTLTF